MSAEGDALRSTASWIKTVVQGDHHYNLVMAAAERADKEVPDVPGDQAD